MSEVGGRLVRLRSSVMRSAVTPVVLELNGIIDGVGELVGVGGKPSRV